MKGALQIRRFRQAVLVELHKKADVYARNRGFVSKVSVAESYRLLAHKVREWGLIPPAVSASDRRRFKADLVLPAEAPDDAAMPNARTASMPADVSFLIERATDPSSMMMGAAANSLVKLAYGSITQSEIQLPASSREMIACEVTVRRLPAHRKTEDVIAGLEEMRAHIMQRWGKASLDAACEMAEGYSEFDSIP